jgi:hypothetical protein
MLAAILRLMIMPFLTTAFLGQAETADTGNRDGKRLRNQALLAPTDAQPHYTAATRYGSSEDQDPAREKLSPAIASELMSIEAMRQAIVSREPVERWRFESVRARYQTMLRRSPNDPVIEEAVRIGVARVARHEQTAEAARTIQAILVQSHRRDHVIADLERQLRSAAPRAARSRAYRAVGFMQPSAQKVEGRKLFVLIGKNGATVAYLDIPPGLDPNPVLASRVGVRGIAHYNEELHSPLITVRNLEAIEYRR